MRRANAGASACPPVSGPSRAGLQTIHYRLGRVFWVRAQVHRRRGETTTTRATRSARQQGQPSVEGLPSQSNSAKSAPWLADPISTNLLAAMTACRPSHEHHQQLPPKPVQGRPSPWRRHGPRDVPSRASHRPVIAIYGLAPIKAGRKTQLCTPPTALAATCAAGRHPMFQPLAVWSYARPECASPAIVPDGLV